jgi:hypothetical protein
LIAGVQLRVRAGEQIPVDLCVTRGESACDESNLTGESRAISKQPGDVALAGTLNLWGVLDGKALRPASESAVQRIIKLIEQAQQFKAPSQRFSDRFGTQYTYLVLAGVRGLLPCRLALARLAAIPWHRKRLERILSRDDVARGDVSVRARAECAVGDSVGDRLRRATRRSFPRRRGDRDARRTCERWRSTKPER